EGFAAPGVAADRQRAQRVAVIALPARDEMPAGWLPDLDEILPRQLQRGFDGLRTARDEVDVIQIARRAGRKEIGQVFADLRREEGRMRVRQLFQLLAGGGDDFGMTVAEAGDGGAAGSIDI